MRHITGVLDLASWYSPLLTGSSIPRVKRATSLRSAQKGAAKDSECGVHRDISDQPNSRSHVPLPSLDDPQKAGAYTAVLGRNPLRKSDRRKTSPELVPPFRRPPSVVRRPVSLNTGAHPCTMNMPQLPRQEHRVGANAYSSTSRPQPYPRSQKRDTGSSLCRGLYAGPRAWPHNPFLVAVGINSSSDGG
jgi:hypothetical protein